MEVPVLRGLQALLGRQEVRLDLLVLLVLDWLESQEFLLWDLRKVLRAHEMGIYNWDPLPAFTQV